MCGSLIISITVEYGIFNFRFLMSWSKSFILSFLLPCLLSLLLLDRAHLTVLVILIIRCKIDSKLKLLVSDLVTYVYPGYLTQVFDELAFKVRSLIGVDTSPDYKMVIECICSVLLKLIPIRHIIYKLGDMIGNIYTSVFPYPPLEFSSVRKSMQTNSKGYWPVVTWVGIASHSKYICCMS